MYIYIHVHLYTCSYIYTYIHINTYVNLRMLVFIYMQDWSRGVDDATNRAYPVEVMDGEGIELPLRMVTPLPYPLRLAVFPVTTARLQITNSHLLVRQRPDGSYQTVAGRSVVAMHRLNMRLAQIDSGLVNRDGNIRCLLLARAPARVHEGACFTIHAPLLLGTPFAHGKSQRSILLHEACMHWQFISPLLTHKQVLMNSSCWQTRDAH